MAIGREPANDLVIENPSASRRHARDRRRRRPSYSDLGGGNGTLLNGEVLRNASRWLNSGDSIEIGHENLRYITGEQTMFGAAPRREKRSPRSSTLEGSTLTMGRDPSNDLVLDDPNVSRFHAEVRRTPDGGAELRDLGSRNGTRLDREFIRQRAPIRAGSEIGIGPFRLVYDGTNFVRRDDRGALRLRGEGITIAVKDKVILNGATIAVEPGEFVVIIGESGSGKTTMLKALAGVTTPTSGRVLVSGEPVLTRLTDIGYVPQDEIVHRGLTVTEGLRYSAALRLPRDSSEADIDGAVERVLSELGLERHADTLVGSLSGGQRKRVGVGTELLNRPSLLFLDEPTTGLDPGLETQLMELFRDLAEEGTRAVIAVTHATKNLHLADKVCVMGVGGELSFFGPPEEAKAFFGVDDFDGIYTALETRPATEWRARFEATEPEFLATVEQQGPAAAKPAPRPQPNVGRQTWLLAQRYAKLLLRDRRNLMILLGQAPLIALGIALLFQKGVLDVGADPTNAALMLFLVVTTMIWLGSIDGSREVHQGTPADGARTRGGREGERVPELEGDRALRPRRAAGVDARRRHVRAAATSRVPAGVREGVRDLLHDRLHLRRHGPADLVARLERGSGCELHPARADPAASLRWRDRGRRGHGQGHRRLLQRHLLALGLRRHRLSGRHAGADRGAAGGRAGRSPLRPRLLRPDDPARPRRPRRVPGRRPRRHVLRPSLLPAPGLEPGCPAF